MNKVLKIGGGIVALLVAALLVAPFFIDLNSYKGLIAEQAKQATGRELVIAGDISLSLLPMPAIAVEGLKFGNAPGGQAPYMLEAQAVKVRVALMPLLSGRAEIKGIELIEPVIQLEKLADGSGNWEMAPKAAPAEPAPTDAGAGDGFDLSIAGASISDGVLVYRDIAAGTEQRIDDLNTDLSLASLKGPFSATGGMNALGMPVGFSIDLGAIEPQQPVPLALTLKIADAGASLDFSGAADFAAADTAERPILTGKLGVKAENLAKLAAILTGGPENPILAQPLSMEGDVAAGTKSATVENLTAALGDMNAKGRVGAGFANGPDIAIELAMGRLDLDKILAADADKSSDAGPAAPGGFTLPRNVKAKADVAIEQVVLRGNAIDRVKIAVALKDGRLDLAELSGGLPGATKASLAGSLEAVNGQPAFIGGIDLESSNLRGLIDAFAKGAVDAVPGDRLRALALSGRISVNPAQVSLSDMAAKLDASKIGGGVTVALPDGKTRKRLAFGIGLAIDQLNLDGYLPKAQAKSEAAAEAAPGNPLRALAPLGELDANIEIRAGALTLNEQEIKKLHATIGLKDGAMRIDDLSVGDLMGGKGAVSGNITGLKADPRFDVAFDVTAKDAGRVLRMAGLDSGTQKFGALTLKGKAAGGGDDVTYDVLLGMTGIGLSGTAKGGAAGLFAGGIPQINSTFDVKVAKLAPLLALAGPGEDRSGADKETQIKAAEQLGAVGFKGWAKSGTDDLDYDIDLTMAGIGGTGKLTGRIAGIKETPSVDTLLDLRAEKPAALLQLAGLAGPKAKQMGALSAKGSLKGMADDMNLDLIVGVAGASGRLAGNVKAKAKPIGFDLALAVTHPEFTELLALADLPSSGAKAGPLDLKTQASGSTEKASLRDLDFRWGDSNLRGAVDYDATAGRPNIRADLEGGIVNLVPFMAPGKGGGTSAGGESTGGGSAGGGGAPWSNEPLDLSALDKQDADIDFKAEALILPDRRIDNLAARITVKDGTMSIETLTGNIYGGGFDLSGTSVTGRGTPAIDAKVALSRIETGELMGGGIAGNQVKGPLSVNLAATGSGGSEAALVRSLNGSGNIDGTIMVIGKVEQTVGSALLGVLGQKVKQIQGVTQGINNVVASFTGIDNEVAGSFNVNNGVLDTQDLTFTNPRARGAARGQVDLAAWAMNMLVDLFGAGSDQAFMSINLTGPVDSPRPAFSGSGAAGPAAGGTGIPGLNLPGVNIPGVNIPGLGGQTGTGTTTQPGVQLPGLGGVTLPGLGNVLGTQPATEPVPVEPLPVEPVPVEPAPVGPGPVEPAPVEIIPVEPVPVEPAPVEPLVVEPAPVEPAPLEPTPVEPAPVEPLPLNEAPTTEPGALPPGGDTQQQPGILLPGTDTQILLPGLSTN